MVSTRLTLGVTTALLLASSAAFAQGGMQGQMEKLAQTTPEERAKAQTAVMKETLALTDPQVPAVAKINLEIATQMQPVLESSDGPLVKMRKAKAIEGQRDAELEKVLLPQQYQQWLAEKEAMKQKAEAKLMEKHAGDTN